MLNRKGQALVEFILVLPILIMLIFAVIDFGRIFVNKNKLETLLGTINDIDKEDINYDNIYEFVNKNQDNEISTYLTYDSNGYVTIKLEEKLDLITPFLNLILDDPYIINATRMVKYE